MTSLIKNDVPRDPLEKKKSAGGPKRFIFDFPEPPVKKNEYDDSPKVSEKSELEAFLPPNIDFPLPKDYKEAYDSICKAISSAYKETRQACTGAVKDILGGLNFRDPKDCVEFLKEMVFALSGKTTKGNSTGPLLKETREYEKLLQKAELKVRDLIRNEQIYRISFDQYTYRYEETERIIVELQHKLREKRIKIEQLTQETNKLASIIQYKEEEIRSILYESQNYGQNPPAILSQMSPQTESPLTPDQQKAKLRSLNLQNLKILLHNSKGTPSDSTDMTPNADSTRGLNSSKKPGRVISPVGKNKNNDRSSGKSIGSGSGLLTLKINTGEKIKESRDTSNHRIEVLTERRKLDTSTEQKVNTSERLLDSFNFNLRSIPPKQANSQLYIQEPSKSKPNQRKLVRQESSNLEDKSIHSARLRPYEDTAAMLFRTENSEDMEAYSATLTKAEKKKREEMQRQLQAKREEYQLLNSTRLRKSGTSKMRPAMSEDDLDSQEKSPKLKHVVTTKDKQTFGLSLKNTSKEKSPNPVDKNDSKTPQNNAVFMNIMLKKLTGQKAQIKKAI